MSINSAEQHQAASSRIFNDYSVSEGSSNSLKEENQIRRTKEEYNDLNNYSTLSFKKPYKIPLNVVKTKVSKINLEMQELLDALESLLDRVYINPFLDNDIEECHFSLWEEVRKNNQKLFQPNLQEGMAYVGGSPLFDETTGEYISQEVFKNPEYISFRQYLYAEQHACRGCRKFVKEYDRLISHSVFVHLFDFRYYVKLLLHEAHCIKESLLYDFGDDYEDESQQQAAAFYFSWTKMAENHSRLITEELARQADSVPTSEVDNISKKQAAQFQAFFSIRVASYTEAVDNLLFSLKKDLEDTCEVFYKRFVAPSLRFKTKVAAPLELDLLTTSLGTAAPILSEEVITAVNAFKGNFGSILTDMVQRRNNTQSKFDKLLSFNLQRKKYIAYIDSLAVKASSRPKIVLSNVEDKTSELFDSIFIDKSKRESLKSSHDNLDDLDTDSHPQYLMRSGGNIFGDISVAEGVTIDGVDLDQHAHTGEDGTVKIKSTDIDYESVRSETVLLETEEGNALQVSIDSFLASIKQGGVPSVDAVILMSIPDEFKDKYEFEIMYVENQ
jgi:hypothetical protein